MFAELFFTMHNLTNSVEGQRMPMYEPRVLKYFKEKRINSWHLVQL